MNLVFDIETDGLDYSVIFCIVAYDIDNEVVYKFKPSELQEGIDLLSKADKLIGHNIIGFDIPVVKELYGVDLSKNCTIRDTLVLSRLINPTREGGHSLASWGFRLGHRKMEHEDFTQYSNDMLKYCVNDVLVNAKVYNILKSEAKGFSAQCVDIEQNVYALLDKQRRKGFLLDWQYILSLKAELEETIETITKEVQKEFKPKEEVFTLRLTYNADGAISRFAKCRELDTRVRLNEVEYKTICRDKKIKRTIRHPFNLGSRKQIGEYLKDFGWKPKKFTPTGQPIVDEKVLSKIKNIPQAKLIAEYLMLQKRIAAVKSWIKESGDDDRVHGYVNSNGTITGRMTHNSPNMAQIPSLSSPYGKECRQCWVVPQGYKLVGIDASGLELRMLAHYMEDEDYTNEIINGDVHTANQRLAGLESRTQAKTFIYALLYGAGDPKLGTVAGGGREVGARLRKSFFDNLPSFKSLKDKVGRAAKKGHIKGIDGRKLIVRSEHAALNTLLQSAGAIVMKKALIIFEEKIKDIDAHVVANVHDEWQVETEQTMADTVGNLGVEAIREAGLALKLKCPLDGEYNVGNNWAETH